jgi:hypothetical protein
VLFDLVRERRPVALDQACGGDAPGDGALDIAVSESRAAMAGPAHGPFEKPDFAGEVFEEDTPKAVHVVVRDVAEGHREAVVEALGEEDRRKILGDEAQQVGLTRFGGHPESLARGAADAKNTSTVFAGVSPTDGRPRPCWT